MAYLTRARLLIIFWGSRKKGKNMDVTHLFPDPTIFL